MKIETVKLILSIAIALLLGFVCEELDFFWSGCCNYLFRSHARNGSQVQQYEARGFHQSLCVDYGYSTYCCQYHLFEFRV